MQKILQNKIVIYLLIGFSLFGLIVVRALETHLFYDPFLIFFKSNYQSKPLPKFDAFLLFGHYFLRYFLNFIFSISLIYLIFKDLKLLKLSFYLYIFFFFLLIIALSIILFLMENTDYMLLFYIRRFLIQPLFVVLFIPAFYYQQKFTEKS
jgi:exosortase F-associated protein